MLIRNLTAIMTGLQGPAARHAGPDIRVKGTRIEAIGALEPMQGEPVLDGTDCVAYPAWVNTHHHLFQSVLKGDPLGINATLGPWLAATPLRMGAALDEASFRTSVRIGLVELALSGCGTVADHHYLNHPFRGFDGSAIVFEEAAALGLRMVLCRGGNTRARAQDSDAAKARAETFEEYLGDVERLVTRFHDPAPDAMRRVVVAPTSPPWSMHPQELRDCAAFARQHGLRLHSHLSETVNYQDIVHETHGMTPVQWCAELGWLGPDVWFAHLVKLDSDEIALLGSTGTGIAHCPQSNARLGSGIAPVVDLEAAGATVSIGVDGAASNEAADMIGETHAAWAAARARKGEAARARYRGGEGESGADAATIEDVVRWGSAGGAQVLGLDALGTIEAGRCADIAVYSLAGSPRYFGMHDPAIAPVACGGAAHLAGLLVAGRLVVKDGEVAGLDMKQLAEDSRAAVARIQSVAGP